MEEQKTGERNKNNKVHPKEKANFFSQIFFCWPLPFFVKGFKKDLTEEDLYGPLKEHKSNTLGDKLEKAWKKQASKKNPSLMKALFSVFGLNIFLIGLFYTVIEFGAKLSVPILMSKLLSYYEPNQTSVTREDSLLYAGGIVLSSFFTITLMHTYVFTNQHLGMKIKVACCSLIYRKALKLSKSSLAETTIGQMVNLLSNDVNRFEQAVLHMHHLWGGPLATAVILYLIYTGLDEAALSGTLLLFLFLPLQVFLGKKTSIYRLRIALKSDVRIRLMNEIITGIQVIKMYTWEKPFAKLIEAARRDEVQQIRNNSFIKAFNMTFPLIVNRSAIYLSVIVYVLLGNRPTAQYVFVISSFYNMLRQTVTMSFPQGVTHAAESRISIKRIEKFLLHDEIQKDVKISNLNSKEFGNGIVMNDNHKNTNNHNIGVYTEKASAKWLKSISDNTLDKVNFNAGANQLVAIVGPVGSGKSSLLHIILKELPLISGNLQVGGTVSYASQEPWLFSGSIKQNILFGHEYEEKKYQKVVKVCALQKDFSLFPYGDRTLVGERGITLSGGQKARVNLARSIYKDADIYLLDDPLSAVDTHVGKQLFDECISSYLKNKCTILVTHQLQYLKSAHKIYLIEDGKVTQSGSYEQLKNSGNKFTKLLEDNKEEENEENIFKRQISESESRKDEEVNLNEPKRVKEQQATGSIRRVTYSEYFNAAGRFWILCILLSMCLIAQILATLADYFVSFWSFTLDTRLEKVIGVIVKIIQ